MYSDNNYYNDYNNDGHDYNCNNKKDDDDDDDDNIMNQVKEDMVETLQYYSHETSNEDMEITLCSIVDNEYYNSLPDDLPESSNASSRNSIHYISNSSDDNNEIDDEEDDDENNSNNNNNNNNNNNDDDDDDDNNNENLNVKVGALCSKSNNIETTSNRLEQLRRKNIYNCNMNVDKLDSYYYSTYYSSSSDSDSSDDDDDGGNTDDDNDDDEDDDDDDNNEHKEINATVDEEVEVEDKEKVASTRSNMGDDNKKWKKEEINIEEEIMDLPIVTKKANVLCLGMSYPHINEQITKEEVSWDNIDLKHPCIDQTIELVRRNVLTQMDGRDLARCQAMEQHAYQPYTNSSNHYSIHHVIEHEKVKDQVDENNGDEGTGNSNSYSKRMPPVVPRAPRIIPYEKQKIKAYTVSQELGAVYDSACHLNANFNSHRFIPSMKKLFGDEIKFQQIILDYFWIPQGTWVMNHWGRSFFEKTLPEFVKENLIEFEDDMTFLKNKYTKKNNNGYSAATAAANVIPLSPSKQGQQHNVPHKKAEMKVGAVYLPFTFHCMKMLVTYIKTLSQYYTISFVYKNELSEIALYEGTQHINPTIMQEWLGKQLNQEDVYCTFNSRDVSESIEDAYVKKDDVVKVLKQINNFTYVRMIRLIPLQKHNPKRYTDNSDSNNNNNDVVSLSKRGNKQQQLSRVKMRLWVEDSKSQNKKRLPRQQQQQQQQREKASTSSGEEIGVDIGGFIDLIDPEDVINGYDEERNNAASSSSEDEESSDDENTTAPDESDAESSSSSDETEEEFEDHDPRNTSKPSKRGYVTLYDLTKREDKNDGRVVVTEFRKKDVDDGVHLPAEAQYVQESKQGEIFDLFKGLKQSVPTLTPSSPTAISSLKAIANGKKKAKSPKEILLKGRSNREELQRDVLAAILLRDFAEQERKRSSSPKKKSKNNSKNSSPAKRAHKHGNLRTFFRQLWHRIHEDTESNDGLVAPNDKEMISDLLYLVFEQMRRCRLENSDKIGIYKERKIGYPGMICRYCDAANEAKPSCGKYFPASLSSLYQSTFTSTLINHVMNCERCPITIRNRVKLLNKELKEHRRSAQKNGEIQSEEIHDKIRKQFLEEANAVEETQEEEEEEVNEEWDLVEITSIEHLKKRCPTKCLTEGCNLFASSLWVLSDVNNTNLTLEEKKRKLKLHDQLWYSCIDCQEVDYDGWPPDKRELPLTHMSNEHRRILSQLCSKKKSPKMPNLPKNAPAEKDDRNDVGADTATEEDAVNKNNTNHTAAPDDLTAKNLQLSSQKETERHGYPLFCIVCHNKCVKGTLSWKIGSTWTQPRGLGRAICRHCLLRYSASEKRWGCWNFVVDETTEEFRQCNCSVVAPLYKCTKKHADVNITITEERKSATDQPKNIICVSLKNETDSTTSKYQSSPSESCYKNTKAMDSACSTSGHRKRRDVAANISPNQLFTAQQQGLPSSNSPTVNKRRKPCSDKAYPEYYQRQSPSKHFLGYDYSKVSPDQMKHVGIMPQRETPSPLNRDRISQLLIQRHNNSKVASPSAQRYVTHLDASGQIAAFDQFRHQGKPIRTDQVCVLQPLRSPMHVLQIPQAPLMNYTDVVAAQTSPQNCNPLLTSSRSPYTIDRLLQNNPVKVVAHLADEIYSKYLGGFTCSDISFEKVVLPCMSIAELASYLLERVAERKWLLRICYRATGHDNVAKVNYISYGHGLTTKVEIPNAKNNSIARISVGIRTRLGGPVLAPEDPVHAHLQQNEFYPAEVYLCTYGISWQANPIITNSYVLRTNPVHL